MIELSHASLLFTWGIVVEWGQNCIFHAIIFGTKIKFLFSTVSVCMWYSSVMRTKVYFLCRYFWDKNSIAIWHDQSLCLLYITQNATICLHTHLYLGSVIHKIKGSKLKNNNSFHYSESILNPSDTSCLSHQNERFKGLTLKG